MTSLARRAHPFTVGAVALTLAALVMIAPAPRGTIMIYLATSAIAVLTGAHRGVVLGLIICVPLWLFLFLMHGVLGEGPRIDAAWGGTVSASGIALALAQGSRLAAIITASLAFATAFDPHRFLQAAIARGWRFDGAFVVVATLDAADRLAAQARRLREAQRTRGLRVRGSLQVRARALPALVFPLLLASLTEADERALALETRGLTIRGPRTAIDPPIDTLLDRAVRWGALAIVITALAWRLAP